MLIWRQMNYFNNNNSRCKQKQHHEQIQVLLTLAQKYERKQTAKSFKAAFPSFSAFDSASELWTDYWARFNTFLEAHSFRSEKRASVFLTNQTPVTYKRLIYLAGQQTPSKDVNQLNTKEISELMTEQFHPKCFMVCERYNLYSHMDRKPGETIQELVVHIRQDPVT